MSEQRIERDTMGEVAVPAEALWGASTQRAVDNFPVSGIRFPRRFIRALALIKQAAAETNAELGRIDAEIGSLIAKAAGDVADGAYDDHFVLDIFQTGSGTSTNTNANEVIANLANLAAGSELGSKSPVHPNDHVNKCQSSNDVIPSTIHVAALDAVVNDLLPALERLREALAAKAIEFDEIYKSGRTHLMDAAPVRLGQEFSGFARQIELGMQRVNATRERLGELALGGTATGTGLQADKRFAAATIAKLSARTGLALREATDHFEAQGAQDAAVEVSGALKTVAVSLCKIANDLRWMASGPNTGLGEIRLPDLQPGSSIMPGKVNPVMCEVATQVAGQVFGNDAAITFGGATGNLDLNVMLPLIAHNLLESIQLLSSSSRLLAEKCVAGIEANVERCQELVERTDQALTALNARLGYDAVAALVKRAQKLGKTGPQLAREEQVLPADELEKLLDVRWMTRGGFGPED